MTLNAAFDKFEADIYRIVAEEATLFFSKLQSASPVDTGTFKGAWQIRKLRDTEWEISNGVMYASILWDGRRLVGNVTRGSEQWPQGGAPMLLEANRRIEQRLSQLRM